MKRNGFVILRNVEVKRVYLALSAVGKTTHNNAFKFALAKIGQASQEAKAHSFTKPSLARFRNVLNARR